MSAANEDANSSEVDDRMRELKGQVEFQERLLDAVGEAVIATDPQGVITYWNRAAEEMYGWSADEVLDRSLVDVTATDASRAEAEAALKRLQAGQARRGEFEARRRDGTTFPVLVTDTPLMDDDGRLVGIIGVSRDVTERVRAAEALRESDARYRTLADDVLETSEVGTFVLDQEFRVVWINQAIEEYFGLEREDVVGADKRRLIRHRIKHMFEDADGFEKRLLAAYDDNSYTERFECHVLPDDGQEERWLRHWSQPIRSGLYAGGRIEHYTDVTAQRRAHDEVESARRRAQSILESITDAFVAVDNAWRFTYVNKQAEALLLRRADELMGQNLWNEFPDTVDSLFYTENHRAMEQRQPVSYQEHYGGLDKWFDVRAYPSDTGLSIYFRDVTEERRAGEELQAARREVEATEKLAAMGTLVSGVAHEIRTPLTYIGNNAFLIRHALQRVAEEHPDAAAQLEEAMELTGEVAHGVERANRLVKDLREFTKRKLDDRAPAQLHEVVGDAVRLFHKTHRGRVRVEADLQPAGEMDLDKLQVQQVVLNLLENATDATESGGTVRLATRAVRGHGHIVVRDEGPGVPEGDVDRIFDPFYTTKEEGTGLGLAIVQRIVRVHGGTLEVDSTAGEGATFTVMLPQNGHDTGDGDGSGGGRADGHGAADGREGSDA